MLLLYFQYLRHTSQFIMSKLPACMNSTNRSCFSIWLVYLFVGFWFLFFFFCKCIGNYKLNYHLSINFCLGPLHFGHTSNCFLRFDQQMFDQAFWQPHSTPFSVQKVSEITKSGGWQEEILRINVSSTNIYLFTWQLNSGTLSAKNYW